MSSWVPKQTPHTAVHNKNKYSLGEPEQREGVKLELAEAVERNHNNWKPVGGFEERDGRVQG